MDTVVVKFGGTSLASQESRAQAISHIEALRTEQSEVVVVVSAMGRKGSPYATDTLLSLVHDNNTAPAIQDLLMSCGETISACVFANTLTQYGIRAVAMTGAQAGIVTDSTFGRADIFDIDTTRVKTALYEGKMPVITGFQGVNVRGEITTLGRGGSDTSAVTIGGFLKAKDIYIFTDVPGIAITDPRIVPAAPFLEEVGLRQMHALARWGAGVIHPRAVAAAERHGVNVWVRSTFDKQPGTKLSKNARMRPGPVGIALLRGYDVTQCGQEDDLIVYEGKRRLAVRTAPGSGYSLLTVVFNGWNTQEMLASMGETVKSARCFYSESCVHVLAVADEAVSVAQELYARLFENVLPTDRQIRKRKEGT